MVTVKISELPSGNTAADTAVEASHNGAPKQSVKLPFSFATIPARTYVLSKTVANPPGAPAENDRYIVGAGGTGAWAGKDGFVAEWLLDGSGNGAWFFAKANGLIYVQDAHNIYMATDNALALLFTDGVNAELVDYGNRIGVLEATAGAPGLNYDTLAALNGDLAHPADTVAFVNFDATLANNGKYLKIGASGVGNWSKTIDRVDAETARAEAAEDLAFQQRANILAGGDINAATQIGSYLAFAGWLNGPAAAAGSNGQIDVVMYDNRWVVQHFITLNNPNLQWYRTIDTAGVTYSAWAPLGVGDSVPVYNGTLTAADDLNTAVLAGFYIVSNPAPANTPVGLTYGNGSTAMMSVQRYNARFIIQTLTTIDDATRGYTRAIDIVAPLYPAWSGFGITTGVSNQIIATAGDSITFNGTYQPSMAARLGGAAIVNVGFPSTTLTYAAGGTLYYRDLSFSRLVDSIISGNWTTPDAAIAALAGMGKNYTIQYNALKALDFTTLRYLWIAHGTNDYGENMPLGVDSDTGQTTFCGAFNYTNTQLMTAFPNLQILWGAPIWRSIYNGPGGPLEDADICPNGNGAYLWQFVDAMLRLGSGNLVTGGVPVNRNKVPVYDGYRLSGINKFNGSTRLVDWLHPSTGSTPSYSAQLYGHGIAGFIQSHV